MAQHTLATGDTWPRVAAKHGIKYWQNIYLAPENKTLRDKRGDPANFKFGDVIHIPDKAAIRPMENHPVIVHRKVPLFTQSELTCWRATAKMLYLFKYPESSEAAFNNRIGSRYLDLEAGLEHPYWSDFYSRVLGMTEKKLTLVNDLHYLLAIRGPVVAAIGEGESKHSVLMAGYDILKGKWLRLDPASGEQFTFSDDEIVVGAPAKPAPGAGSKPSKVTFKAAPAKWENMASWLWIMDTEMHPRVFFY